MALEFQIAVPGHRRQGAMEKGMGVVQKAWKSGILYAGQPTAWDRGTIHGNNPQTTAAHIRLQNQCIVSRPENNSIAVILHSDPFYWNAVLERRAFECCERRRSAPIIVHKENPQ